MNPAGSTSSSRVRWRLVSPNVVAMHCVLFYNNIPVERDVFIITLYCIRADCQGPAPESALRANFPMMCAFLYTSALTGVKTSKRNLTLRLQKLTNAPQQFVTLIGYQRPIIAINECDHIRKHFHKPPCHISLNFIHLSSDTALSNTSSAGV